MLFFYIKNSLARNYNIALPATRTQQSNFPDIFWAIHNIDWNIDSESKFIVFHNNYLKCVTIFSCQRHIFVKSSFLTVRPARMKSLIVILKSMMIILVLRLRSTEFGGACQSSAKRRHLNY